MNILNFESSHSMWYKSTDPASGSTPPYASYSRLVYLDIVFQVSTAGIGAQMDIHSTDMCLSSDLEKRIRDISTGIS